MTSAARDEEKRVNFILHFSSGLELLRRERWRLAADQFKKATQHAPRDIGATVLRAQCLLALGDSAAAAAEASRVLELEAQEGHDRAYRGTLLQAEVLYAQGNFEQALKCYHRGRRLRPDLDVFQHGIAKCDEALLGTVAREAAHQRNTTSASKELAARSLARCMPELAADAKFLRELANSRIFSNDGNLNNVFHESFCRNNHNHPYNKFIRGRSEGRAESSSSSKKGRSVRKDAVHAEDAHRAMGAGGEWSEEELARLIEQRGDISSTSNGAHRISAAQAAAKAKAALRARPVAEECNVSEAANDAMRATVDEALQYIERRRDFWVHNDPVIRFPPPPPVAAVFDVHAPERPRVPRPLSATSHLLATTAATEHRRQASRADTAADLEHSCCARSRTTPAPANLVPVPRNSSAAPALQNHLLSLAPSPPPQSAEHTRPSRPTTRNDEQRRNATPLPSPPTIALGPSSVQLDWVHINDAHSGTRAAVAACVKERIGTQLAYEQPLRGATTVHHAHHGSVFAVQRALDEDPAEARSGLARYFGLGRAATTIGISSRAKHMQQQQQQQQQKHCGPVSATPSAEFNTNKDAARANHIADGGEPRGMPTIDRRGDDDSDAHSTATTATAAGAAAPVASPVQVREYRRELLKVRRLLRHGELPAAIAAARALLDRARSLGAVDSSVTPRRMLAHLRFSLGELFVQAGAVRAGIKELSRAAVEAKAAGETDLAARATKALVREYSQCGDTVVLGDEGGDSDESSGTDDSDGAESQALDEDLASIEGESLHLPRSQRSASRSSSTTSSSSSPSTSP